MLARLSFQFSRLAATTLLPLLVAARRQWVAAETLGNGKPNGIIAVGRRRTLGCRPEVSSVPSRSPQPPSKPRRQWLAILLVGVSMSQLGWPTSATAADPSPVPTSGPLLAALQPLRFGTAASDVPPVLRPAAADFAKQRFARACQSANKLWLLRMQEASRLFYAEQRTTESAEAVERFLAKHVYGPAATLTIVHEAFVPVPALRNLAADACARAGTPAAAVPLLAAAGSLPGDPQAKTALAVLMGAAGRDWSLALPVLQGDRTSVRAILLAALADSSQSPAAWLGRLQGADLRPDEQAAVAAVRLALTKAGHLAGAARAQEPAH